MHVALRSAWMFAVMGFTLLGADGVLAQTPSSGSGQTYPNKPIRLVASDTSVGPGLIARITADGIAASLGQPMVMDIRPTRLVPEAVAKAPPDGYTVLAIGGSMWLLPFMADVNHDPVRDFAPIAMMAKALLIIVVHPSLPVMSVKELIALARARPGEINYASGVSGSPNHLATELFKSMARINLAHIPYKSTAPAVNALLGGQIQLMFGPATAVGGLVKSGRLKALAVSSARPSALFPGLPAVASSVPGYEAISTYGMFAPAKTPASVISRLNQEIVRYLRTPQGIERILSAGAEPAASSPEELAAHMKAEMAVMGPMIRDVGIRAE